jgi:uncharacterized protein YndB with AHSA1/START domain
MIDIVTEINATRRVVEAGRGGADDVYAVRLRRCYDAPIEDVWDACTSQERITRWFLPVTGDLRLGGSYQLEGNAGGEILRCEPPRLLRVTWVFGDGPASEVEVRLSPGDHDDTLLELDHTMRGTPPMWAEFGPGAVGVGWDMALLGFGRYLSGHEPDEARSWSQSAQAREFMTRSSRAWGAAHEASGATAAEAGAAAERTTSFYTGEPQTAD